MKQGNNLSEVFYTDRGLRLDDAPSCFLFKSALEKAIRAPSITARGIIYQKTIQNLTFAVDIALIDRFRKFVTEAFNALEAEAGKLGLKIKEGKTKFMETSQNTPNLHPFTKKNYIFETVS